MELREVQGIRADASSGSCCARVMSASDARRVAAALWRIESPKLIRMLGRLVRNVDSAEELALEALTRPEALATQP